MSTKISPYGHGFNSIIGKPQNHRLENYDVYTETMVYQDMMFTPKQWFIRIWCLIYIIHRIVEPQLFHQFSQGLAPLFLVS